MCNYPQYYITVALDIYICFNAPLTNNKVWRKRGALSGADQSVLITVVCILAKGVTDIVNENKQPLARRIGGMFAVE